MKLVFMGTPDFAVPSLQSLVESDHDVVAAVTRPDARKGRGRRLSAPPVKRVAQDRGVSVLQPRRLKDPNFIDALARMHPDLIVVVAFRILPTEVLAVPRLGAINLHASLLPKYRGAAPMHWAIINGERTTGVTVFLLDAGVDTGQILLQRPVEIGPEETVGELHDRLAQTGPEVLLQALELLASGRVHPVPQPAEGVSAAPKLSRADCAIDWSEDAEVIRNLIRGTNPYPGAFTMWKGKTLKVHRASVRPLKVEGKPGEVLGPDPRTGILVATGCGVLALEDVQLEGKRSMSAAEFVRGQDVAAGERVG